MRVCPLSKTMLLRFFKEVLFEAFRSTQENSHEQAIEEFQECALGATQEHSEREQPLFKSRGVNSERKYVHDAIVHVVQGMVVAVSVPGEGTALIDVGSVTGSTPTSVSAPGFLAQVFCGPTFAFLLVGARALLKATMGRGGGL